MIEKTSLKEIWKESIDVEKGKPKQKKKKKRTGNERIDAAFALRVFVDVIAIKRQIF